MTELQTRKIENYLLQKKNMNDHEGTPWMNVSTKLFKCSITENEDTITAILDILGCFLSNLNDEQKQQVQRPHSAGLFHGLFVVHIYRRRVADVGRFYVFRVDDR